MDVDEGTGKMDDGSKTAWVFIPMNTHRNHIPISMFALM